MTFQRHSAIWICISTLTQWRFNKILLNSQIVLKVFYFIIVLLLISSFILLGQLPDVIQEGFTEDMKATQFPEWTRDVSKAENQNCKGMEAKKGPVFPNLKNNHDLHSFARGAITKYHGGRDSMTEIHILTVLETESLRSTCQQGWFLPRLLPLACRWPPSPHPHVVL